MSEYKLLKTQEEESNWDRFLQESPRGHYGVLSGWLHSFDVYGGRPHILTLQKEGRIIGGMGMVEMGKGPFRVLSVLMGPILWEGYENYAYELIERIRQYAQQLGVFLLQIKTPSAFDHKSSFLLPSLEWNDGRLREWEEGYPFSVVGVPNVLYLVDLKKELPNSDEWEKIILMSFNTNTRRNIKKGNENNLIFKTATREREVKEAYNVIENNGLTQRYSVRPWEHFKHTALKQISSGEAIMAVAIHDNKIVGAQYALIAGKRYCYSMGGTLRLEKDLKIGHFLHWHAIKKSKELGLYAYDFTSVGTPGVKRFKEGFRPTLITLDPPRYIVLSRWKFELFHSLFPWMKRNKAKLARIIKRQGNKTSCR